MMKVYAQKTMRFAMILFGLIILLMIADGIDDYREGQTLMHIIVELMVVACSLLGIAMIGKHFMANTLTRMHVMQADLQTAEAEAQRWRRQSKAFIQGLGVEIQKQFERWGLTPAEGEVGLLMLKGFSHQEIADFRNASERTIREQARSVYRKAGLHNKAELSAFFLEDLLLPDRPQANNGMSD